LKLPLVGAQLLDQIVVRFKLEVVALYLLLQLSNIFVPGLDPLLLALPLVLLSLELLLHLLDLMLLLQVLLVLLGKLGA
jgi:hypothetical protein